MTRARGGSGAYMIRGEKKYFRAEEKKIDSYFLYIDEGMRLRGGWVVDNKRQKDGKSNGEEI